MKSIITLIALIVFGVFTFHATPQIKSARKIEMSRIESTQKAEAVKDTPKKEVAVVAPVEQPKPPAPAPAPAVAPAPPKPAPAPVSGSCELAYNFDWPANVAAAICMAESSGIATQTNMGDNHGKCVGSYGLMQNGCFWFPYFGYTLAQAHDPVVNMTVANKIYKRQGSFNAWTTYTSGKYLRFLK